MKKYFYILDSCGDRHGVTVGPIVEMGGTRGFWYGWRHEELRHWASLPGQGHGAADYAYAAGGTLYVALVDRVVSEL